MRSTMAICTQASLLSVRSSQSLLIHRRRLNQARVRSTTHSLCSTWTVWVSPGLRTSAGSQPPVAQTQDARWSA